MDNEACYETSGLMGFACGWPVGLIVAILFLKFSPFRRLALGNGGIMGKVLFFVSSLLILTLTSEFFGFIGVLIGNWGASYGWCGPSFSAR